jgi:ABC-2 type transport system ATP-binding protein
VFGLSAVQPSEMPPPVSVVDVSPTSAPADYSPAVQPEQPAGSILTEGLIEGATETVAPDQPTDTTAEPTLQSEPLAESEPLLGAEPLLEAEPMLDALLPVQAKPPARPEPPGGGPAARQR